MELTCSNSQLHLQTRTHSWRRGPLGVLAALRPRCRNSWPQASGKNANKPIQYYIYIEGHVSTRDMLAPPWSSHLRLRMCGQFMILDNTIKHDLTHMQGTRSNLTPQPSWASRTAAALDAASSLSWILSWKKRVPVNDFFWQHWWKMLKGTSGICSEDMLAMFWRDI